MKPISLIHKLEKRTMNVIKNTLKFIFILLCVQAGTALAALDHFEVILGQETAQVGESMDITIKAVDKNDEVVTDYDGSILVFSESDAEADFPNELSENSYTFQTSDQWEIKFENAVKFKNPGLQDIYVYDLNDENILGIAEVEIGAKEVVKDLEISIYTPENGLTIGKNSIKVSGWTSKNHQIKILLNWEQDIRTTSNDDGIFEKEVEGLIDGENNIQAFVLDSDENEVGASKEVMIKVQSDAPELKTINITPTWEVDTETEISVEVYSSPGLSSSEVILNDIITSLSEWDNGVYTGTINAPSEPGDYDIDVILKDDFWLQSRIPKAEWISVIEKIELNAAVENTDNGISEPSVDLNAPNLEITGLKLTTLKTKSILSWDSLTAATGYNIYKKMPDGELELIDNVSEPRYEIEIVGEDLKYEEFAVKAMTNTGNGETIESDLSEMTKVQTGPSEMIMLLLLAMILGGWFLLLTKTRRA